MSTADFAPCFGTGCRKNWQISAKRKCNETWNNRVKYRFYLIAQWFQIQIRQVILVFCLLIGGNDITEAELSIRQVTVFL